MKTLYNDNSITETQKDEFNSNWMSLLKFCQNKNSNIDFTKHYILGHMAKI